MFALRATVEGEPVPIFEVNTDGDADWHLNENAGAGFRFNIVNDDGTLVAGSGRSQVSTDGVLITVPGVGEFRVRYDPWEIIFTGYETTDPASLGKLWVDPAAGHVLKVSQG
jgi:hypothetical protein